MKWPCQYLRRASHFLAFFVLCVALLCITRCTSSPFWHRRHDLLEEARKLRGAVAPAALPDHRAGGDVERGEVPQGPPEMTIAGYVVLTGGMAGFHPSKRQPLPGTRKFWERVRFLSNAVIGIQAMKEWTGKTEKEKIRS